MFRRRLDAVYGGSSVNDTLTDLAAIPGLATQSSTLNLFFNGTLLPLRRGEGAGPMLGRNPFAHGDSSRN
jgi:hypothetical protein